VDLGRARRILVLRGGGLGDLLFAVPALEAIRAAAPQAEIRLLGSAWLAELISGRPAVIDGPVLVDRVVPLPETVAASLASGDAGDGRDRSALVAAIRDWAPDVAIQLHGGGRHSNALLAAFGAGLTAGTRTPDAGRLDHWIPYVYAQAEVFRWLEVVARLGAPPVAIEPRLAVTGPERARGWSLVPDGGRPLAVIHPGATDPRRHWPPASFGAVASRLLDAGADVAVVGGVGDRDAAGPVLAAGDRVRDLVGRIGLVDLAAVLARASVVVANDSGPVHLARAVGAATVGIYWCGNLVNGGPVWRTRHRPAVAWRVQCPVCARDCVRDRCEHDVSFVADVGVDEVAESALELIGA
jgi:ADP-heptose:LPS heptosyltransferase